MNSLRPRISSFLLAILVLCSTFSFAIEKHYCHGEVVDFSIFGIIDQCCDNESDIPVVEVQCCANVKELIQASNDELQIPLHEDDAPVLYTVNYTDYLGFLYNPTANNLGYKYYIQPQIDKDVQVLYQSFLI